MAEGNEMMMPGLRTKAATSRAHGFRRYHQGSTGRSSSDAHSRSFDVRTLFMLFSESQEPSILLNALRKDHHSISGQCNLKTACTAFSAWCLLHPLIPLTVAWLGEL